MSASVPGATRRRAAGGKLERGRGGGGGPGRGRGGGGGPGRGRTRGGGPERGRGGGGGPGRGRTRGGGPERGRGGGGRPASGPAGGGKRPRRPTGPSGSGRRRAGRPGDRDPGVRRFESPPVAGAAARAAADPREIALGILFEVESRGAFADRLLDARLARATLAPADRRLVTQLVQGVIRAQRRLDWVADALLRIDRESLPTWIRLCLRLGIYQLLFLDRIPRHAAVDETVGLARRHGHPGTAGLVNAILRRLPGALADVAFPDPETDPIAHLGVLESHPDWIVRRWVERFGLERAASLVAANNRPPGVVVRVNRRRARSGEVARCLRAEGIETAPGGLNDACLRLASACEAFRSHTFERGLISVQDESESLVVPLLNPRPGERILDLCAAPGAKLAHIVEWSRGQAEVVGVDLYGARLRRTAEGLARLGHDGVDLVRADGRCFGRPASFDRVLVDAPCSGLGVLRRRPDARWRKSESLVAEMAALQAALLDRAAVLVRPGGRIVYSVCSFEPEECEEQVELFLGRHPGFTIEHPGPGFPREIVDAHGCFRILHDQYDSDGVFGVRLRHGDAAPEADTAAGTAPGR